MSYPEKSATYRNKPAWMDRALAGEKRAEGGPLIDSKGRTLESPDNEFMTNEPPARLVEAGSHHAAQDARDEAAQRTRRSRATPNSFPVGGDPGGESKDESSAVSGAKKALTGALGGSGSRAARGMGQTLGWKRGGSVC